MTFFDTTVHFGQWPPTNDQLAAVIAQIEVQNPSVIGLDIIRDLKVEGRLAEIFQTSETLIGVGEHDAFDFPPILKQRRRVATADVPKDPDLSGYARRILLYSKVDGSEESSISHMGLKLVREYLKKKGTYEEADNPDVREIIINERKIPLFRETYGGYSPQQLRNSYQMLLRWRKGYSEKEQWEDRFPIVTARDLMGSQVDPHLFTDKIVIIGYRTPSIKDRFATPIGSKFGVDLVARATSQILSFIEDNRPMMNTSPEWLEYGLIILLIVLAYLQSRWLIYRHLLREFWVQGGIITGIVFALYLVGYRLFLRGVWLPVGQLIIVYLVGAILLIFGSYLVHFHHLSRTLEQQVTQRTRELEQKTRELEQSHKELKEAQDKLILEAKQLTLGRFAMRMTHNGNTYLSTMGIAYGLLKRNYENWEIWIKSDTSREMLREILEIFEESISELDKIFGTLRGLTLNQSEEKEKLNLSELLLEVAQNYQVICTEKNIQLITHLDSLPPLYYYRLAFKEMIDIVLDNAIDAVQASHRLGQIRLSAITEEEQIRIEIQDNGYGIPSELQSIVTDPFVTTKSQGTGLGLYFVCQNLLKLGGTLKIESQENIGTTVALLIPID